MAVSPPDLESLLGAGWRTATESRREEILRRIGKRSDVILFGAGYLGRHACHDLESSPFRPIAFADNDPSLWGTKVEGLEVLSPDGAAIRFGGNALWLITVYTNSEVIEQCRGMNVPWATCAELSWVLPGPQRPSLAFGLPDRLAVWEREIAEAATLWSDAESASEYRSQVRWRFLLDYGALAKPRPAAETYFPQDILDPSDHEVFVDCGAFTGDTIEAFMAYCGGRFDEIVAVEPDALNCQALQSRVDDWRRSCIGPIRVEAVAAGSHRGTLSFELTGTAGSSVGAGASEVEVAPLDEILANTAPTYIKFDVEGAEHDAIVGAARTISEHSPVLAVCLYHKPEDLWDLPLLIRSLSPRYRFYLRRYSDERWETVCYAVPPERMPA